MTTNRSRLPLLALLLAAIAVAAALVLADGRDLVHRQWTQDSWSVTQVRNSYEPRVADPEPGVQTYQLFVMVAALDAVDGADNGVQTHGGVLTSSGHTLAWLLWTALPTGLVSVAVLALLATALVAAVRRRTSNRMLHAGWVPVIGGPAAATLEWASRWWTKGYPYTPSVDRW